MAECKHKWIGDTCTECGVNWVVNAKYTMAKQEEEIGLLRAEIAETDLLIQDVHNALLSSRRRKAEVAREMVPKDDLLVLQGMLQGSRKRVDCLISERDQWREVADQLATALTPFEQHPKAKAALAKFDTLTRKEANNEQAV